MATASRKSHSQQARAGGAPRAARGEECRSAGASSGDEGARSDSTRAPSATCFENPKARWADILSDDDEQEGPPPSWFPPAQPAASKPAERPGKQPQAAGERKKTRKQRGQAWAEQGQGRSRASGSGSWWSGSSYGGSWGTSSSSSRDWWPGADAHGYSEYGADSGSQWPRRRSSAAPASAAKKLQCQFFIGIEEGPRFHVVRQVLGPRGKHMKDIYEQTGAKLRLRGRGSKFLEGPEQEESEDPLMLCVSSAFGTAAYEEAKWLVQELLEGVYEDYRRHCEEHGEAAPELGLQVHEGPRDGAY